MFSNDKFRAELWSKLSMENISNISNSLENFLLICIGILDKLAPQKKKYNKGNDMPFMNKPLAQARVKRNHLRNEFLKNRSEVNGIILIILSNAIIVQVF